MFKFIRLDWDVLNLFIASFRRITNLTPINIIVDLRYMAFAIRDIVSISVSLFKLLLRFHHRVLHLEA